MCSSHTDVKATLVMNAQNMAGKMLLIFTFLFLLTKQTKKDYKIVNASHILAEIFAIKTYTFVTIIKHTN